MLGIEKREHPPIRALTLDRRTVAKALAQSIDDAVLDAQVGELQASHLCAAASRVDPQ